MQADSLSSINITFLGTASAQPSATRNHSSLALRLGGNVWLFDCGEATQHQIQKSSVKMGKIQKIFITHTHGDHIFGLLPVLASRLNGAGGMVDGVDDPRAQATAAEPPLEIYGPPGTRAYVRTGLAYTHTLLGSPYVVHELHFPSSMPDSVSLPPHPFECLGRDIPQSSGCWSDIFSNSLLSVHAAPISHSVPCVGYVVHEAPVPGKMDPARYVPEIRRTRAPMALLRRLQLGEDVTLSDGTVLHGPARRTGRKIVVLGDTCDPSAIAPLAEGADLLVHEATNAWLPGIEGVKEKEGDTEESVEARAKTRGHSTPQMAGRFAKRVGARKLVLNHFSARYAGDDDADTESRTIMQAIGALAAREFGKEVTCARDFMSLEVERVEEP